MNDTIELPIDIPLEAIDECLGEIYFWFDGEAIASARVSAE